MSLARIMKSGSATVLTFTVGDDPRGDRDQGSWADGDTYDAWYAPPATAEVVAGRDTVTIDAVVTLPADAAVTAGSRIRDQHGQVFTVEGEPSRLVRPGRGTHHIEARLRAASDVPTE